jgi:hypothetical protein
LEVQVYHVQSRCRYSMNIILLLLLLLLLLLVY